MTKEADTEYKSAFNVMPTSQSMSLEAGEVYQGSITVLNPVDSSQDFNYHVEVVGYNVVGENYQLDLFTESNYTMIADWITLENPDGTLRPGERSVVNYTITVPETAPAGGQYAALMVSSNGNNQAGNSLLVQSVYEIASIIYARVAGETVRIGKVANNTVPGFAVSLPVTTSIKFQNDGNIHEVAQISLEVRDVFTGNIVFPENGEAKTVTEIILPESSYGYTSLINGISPLGVYNVKQVVQYMGQTYEEEHTMILCPGWIIVLVAAIIGSLIGLAFSKILKRCRKTNQKHIDNY